MQNRTIIYLSLGSNIGERLQNLEKAKTLISSQLGTIRAVSGTYESGAWGYASENRFYNNCLSVETLLSPRDLLKGIKSIEVSMGRVRDSRDYTDRIIDIDLLFYGSDVFDLPGLKVPHPRLSERIFVLVPLMEIAPDLKHPERHLTIRELADLCEDPGDISPV